MNKLFLYRLALILGQLCLLIVNHFWTFWPVFNGWIWLFCGTYLSIILLLRLSHTKHHQSRLMLLLDLLLWTGYFYFLGGVTNPLIWCLLIPSLLSALSQSVYYTWLITGLANLCYLILWQVGLGRLSAHVGHIDSGMMKQHITGMWLGFIAVSVLLTWVTTTLMQRINAKNRALLEAEKQRQADEGIIKMATLATSMAHELGTPLTSIKLIVNELRLSLDLNDKQQAADLNMLDNQIERCKKVLEELTAVTAKNRMDDNKLMSVDNFVDQLINAVNHDSCEFKIINNTHHTTVLKVDTLLHLASVNVLNNALCAGAKKIRIELNEADQFMSMKVSDDGMGIKHNNQEGLGIGLKLSKRILEAMGGNIKFQSDQNGAQVLLMIPIMKPA